MVPGLDSVNDSMGALENKTPTYAPPTVDQTATSAEDKQQTSPNIQVSDGASSSCVKDRDNLYWVNEKDEKLKPIHFRTDGVIGFTFGYNDPAVQISQPYIAYINVYDLSNKNIVYTGTDKNNNKLFYGDNGTYDSKKNGFYIYTRVGDLTYNEYWDNNVPPQSLIDSGNYSVSIKLVGVTDSTCEIIFDTTNETVTKTETKCDTDGQILSIGITGSDTSNPDLTVLKDGAKGNYISFYINATDKTIVLSQDYKLTVTLVSAINDNDRYVWKTPIDVPSTFMNSNSLLNNLYFSDTEPKTPELIEGNEIPYSITFSFVGVTDPCNYDIGVDAITNSQQEQESALKKLIVKDVSSTDTNKQGGAIGFNLYNDRDPERPQLSGYKFNVKSTIKSTDGTQQWEYIHLDNLNTDTGLFSFKTNTRDNPLTILLANTTPVCTGFTEGKQYSLETLVYNDTTKLQLNKVMLTNAVNTNLQADALGVTGFKNITIDKILNSSNRTVTISLAQVGIFKEEGIAQTQLITDDELKAFINKKINIKIRYNSEPPNGHFDLDQTLTDTKGSIASGPAALSFKTLLGEPDSANVAVVNFPVNGVYYFDLYYDNLLVETITTINIDDRSSIEYNANSAVTPAPTPPTPVANTNKDTDVVNAIKIKKIYSYKLMNDTITIEFEWDKTTNLQTFALESSQLYIGRANIITNVNGTRTTIPVSSLSSYVSPEGVFGVKRDSDTSVLFGTGDENYRYKYYPDKLENTEIATDQPSGKAWEQGKTWTTTLAFGSIDAYNSDDNNNKILAAQKDPTSIFEIIWDTGGKTEISFYLDNTPTGPPEPVPYQLPYALTDSYDVTTFNFGNNCDKLHAFQSTTVNGVSRNVGQMNTKVAKVLSDIYNAGYNPTVVAVEVEVNGPVVKWTVTIDKSTDGKAWVGFSSRGSATSLAKATENFNGNPNSNPPTVGLLENIKKTFPSDASSVELVALGDFINMRSTIGQTRCEFWQKFAKYTLPVTKPPK